MNEEIKKEEIKEETGTAVPNADKQVTPAKKKKPAAFYVVVVVGVVLAAAGGYDRFFSGKSVASTSKKSDAEEKIVAIMPPPPQTTSAATTPIPEGAPAAATGRPIDKTIVYEWVNGLRKAILSPQLGGNVKMDQVAEAWMTAKLMGGNPQESINAAQARNGNRPIHVLHSGVIGSTESAIKEKIEAAAGAKEFVSSSLYDQMGIYVHPLTADKCHVVIVMQAKAASPIVGLPTTSPASRGCSAGPTKKGGCQVDGLPQFVTQQSQNKKSTTKMANKGIPVPMPPPAFGGNVIDVPPPPPGKPSAQVKEDYDPYPDLRNR